MEKLKEAIELNKEYKYNFTAEINEILTVVNGKICGYQCTEEMALFLEKYKKKIINYSKDLKKKDEEFKINEKQGSLF